MALNNKHGEVFTIHVSKNSKITEIETTSVSTIRNENFINFQNCTQRQKDMLNVFLIIPLIFLIILTNIDLAVIPRGFIVPFVQIECQIIFNELNSIILVFAAHYFDYTLIVGKNDSISKRNLGYLAFYSISMKFVVLGILRILNVYEVNPISPRVGDLIAAIFMQIALYVKNWFQHSKPMRSSTEFRKRYRWFIFYKLALVLMNTCFRQASVLFDLIKNMFQPALVFVFIGLNEGITKFLEKAVNKAKGVNEEASARFDVMCNVGCRYSLYIMLIVGYKATMATTITYIVVDTVTVFRLLYKTVKLVGIQGTQERKMIRNALEEVTLQETLVILLPLCFCFIFVMSFYGPNKETSTLVQNETQDTMISTLGKIGAFMVFDLTRIIAFALFLQLTYRISYYKSFSDMMKSYWKVIAVFAAGSIYSVSIGTS